mgnify:CR=1 FL=1
MRVLHLFMQSDGEAGSQFSVSRFTELSWFPFFPPGKHTLETALGKVPETKRKDKMGVIDNLERIRKFSAGSEGVCSSPA